jgi:hypothetical protein
MEMLPTKVTEFTVSTIDPKQPFLPYYARLRIEPWTRNSLFWPVILKDYIEGSGEVKVLLHALSDDINRDIEPYRETSTSLKTIKKLFKDLERKLPADFDMMSYSFTIGAQNESKIPQSTNGYLEEVKSYSHVGFELLYNNRTFTLTKFNEKTSSSSVYRKKNIYSILEYSNVLQVVQRVHNSRGTYYDKSYLEESLILVKL